MKQGIMSGRHPPADPLKTGTTTMEDAALQCKIDAENRVNTLINEHAPALIASAATLVGKPIFKADGTLRADATKVLQLPKLNHPDMIYRHSSSYNLAFTFKTCCTIPNKVDNRSDHCAYAETTVYVGDVTNGIMVKLEEVGAPRKTDYTLAEVRAKQAEARRLKDAYDKARSACFPFGED